MKLKRLLKNIPGCLVKGSDEVNITGLSANSKAIAFGNLFIAKKGKTHDGTKYIAEAVEKGARVILTDLFDPSLKHITQVIHPAVAQIESILAAEYYQNPSHELLTIGITGTNGKTTTSMIIKYLLDCFLGPCGLIGTIEYIVGKNRYSASHTTPDVITNQKMLREMCQEGCKSVVMEVTSHALTQGRVDKIDFDVAVFSNLTWDHLDYHGTMEQYCQAKNQLFRYLNSDKWAVINQDSAWTDKIIEGCSASFLTYGIDQEADLRATRIQLSDHGTSAQLDYRGEVVECHWPLIGRFNVYNCLAAVGVLLTQGFALKAIAEKLMHISPVRGRLEPVKNKQNLKIYVDYAHTDDALINVLSTLSEVKTGKLITVFGCGGDRDKAKRPKMAKACQSYADLSIVTSDNPRSEDPRTICEEIEKGFTNPNAYIVEVERYAAIKKAIHLAAPNDLILIAGKGHETYQIFADQTIEFDDCKVAQEICSEIVK